MKKIYTLIYLIILYFNGLAQITKSNSSITGIVYDSLSLQPLPNANLWLFNTKFGTTTDKNGYFILSDLPKGNYTLKINFLGYKSFQKQIFLKENQQLNLKIYLTCILESF